MATTISEENLGRHWSNYAVAEEHCPLVTLLPSLENDASSHQESESEE